jgi:hypothetical protein
VQNAQNGPENAWNPDVERDVFGGVERSDETIHVLTKDELLRVRPIVRRAFAHLPIGSPRRTVDPGYADLRTALSTSVLPSDQIAPGTL